MQLIPYIAHQFNGAVWRMEIDPVTTTLFLEIRNEEQKQVSFAAINLLFGKLNFDNLHSDERWLTGIESAYNGVLLLHNYQSAGSPEHKGLIAVNSETGQLLWRNYNQAFSHMAINGAVAFDTRIQPRKLDIVDIKTGMVMEAYNPLTAADADNKIVLPEMLNADDTEIYGLTEKPYGNIVHSLYYNNYRIVSLHAQKNNTLSQSLYIFKQGRQVYHDILNDGIQKLQPEAFVLHHHYLIYLKNRSALNVINLETE